MKIDIRNESENSIIIDVVGDIEMDRYYEEDFGAVQAIEKIKAMPNVQKIEANISSYGGSLHAANTFRGYIATHPAPVKIANLYGIVASAATTIAAGFNTRRIANSSNFLIHNPYAGIQGDYKDFKNQSDALLALTKQTAEIWTNLPSVKLSVEEVMGLMDKDTYMSSQEALDLGFVDEIMPESNNSNSTCKDGICIPNEIINKISKEEAARHNLRAPIGCKSLKNKALKLEQNKQTSEKNMDREDLLKLYNKVTSSDAVDGGFEVLNKGITDYVKQSLKEEQEKNKQLQQKVEKLEKNQLTEDKIKKIEMAAQAEASNYQEVVNTLKESGVTFDQGIDNSIKLMRSVVNQDFNSRYGVTPAIEDEDIAKAFNKVIESHQVDDVDQVVAFTKKQNDELMSESELSEYADKRFEEMNKIKRGVK